MKKVWWIVCAIVALAVVVAVFLVNYCIKPEQNVNSTIDLENMPGDIADLDCQQDSDCSANLCCHAKGCTNKENAPACRGVMCTMNCEPGTLDCGQGSCKCVNKQCAAVMK